MAERILERLRYPTLQVQSLLFLRSRRPKRQSLVPPLKREKDRPERPVHGLFVKLYKYKTELKKPRVSRPLCGQKLLHVHHFSDAE